MAPKKNVKPTPKNTKQPSKVEEESLSEEETGSEESASEEENLFVKESKKKPTQTAAKKPAAKKPAASKKQESESEESESEESASEEENLFVKESKKKPTQAASKKPAASKKQESEEESESEESESEEESGSDEENLFVKESKKKVPEKPTGKEAKKKAPAKPAANQSKKKAAAKNNSNNNGEEQVSAFILRQREAEAQALREKEEKKKKQEEEIARRAEQKKIEEEENKVKAAEKAKVKAAEKAKDDKDAKEKSRLEKLAKLTGATGFTAPSPSEKPSYKKKGKKQQPTTTTETLTSSMNQLNVEETATTTTTTTTDASVKDSWDDEDDWETLEDKRTQAEEEAKKAEEEEEAKKKADKEAKKNAKANKNKSNKPTPAVDTTSTSKDKDVEYRSPIICILGHVDTGKTSLLDKIRHTNVQSGEARGITQQIGASFIPVEAIKEQTKILADKVKMDFKIPGLLLIDTPGHESFNNLRSRGSGLCDIAILVIDIMHGIQAQTIESISLLRMRKTPFIVALNKVDRIYDWKPCVNANFVDAYKQQSKIAVQEFDSKVKEVIAALAGQELNAELYWRNKDFKSVVSLVPTSATTGEGMADLMLVAIQVMQKLMLEKVVYQEKLQCTLLEIKVIEGLGCTVDVVLVNGRLNEGDRLIVSGFNGPIETTVRSILTPPPLRESRIKSQYIQHKTIKAAMGVKIVAAGLEKAVPGTSIYVVEDEDEIEDLKAEAVKEIESVLNQVETSGIGVSIQASTIGSLEAFSSFLKKIKVPVANVAVGPVHKKHVMNTAIMLDKDPKYAILLAFDVKIEDSALQAANDMKIKIISEETIYLFEAKLKKHFDEIKQKLREETASKCVWPCILEITDVFRKSKPVLVAARVKEGTLRIGTPIATTSISQEGGPIADIGLVQGIKLNDKDIQVAKRDDHVSVAINDENAATTFARHFDDKSQWYSKISRESINSLKEAWSDELTQQDAQILKYLKTIFKIQ